jgi:hypothetical protein
MIGWFARGLLIVAGFVASWFVTKDAPQFGLMQVAVAIILLVLVVWVLAFWPERWTHVLRRLHKPR